MGNSSLDIALRLSVAQTGLEHISALIGELKKAGIETDQFEQEATQLGAELRKLGQEQGMIDAFKKLKTETAASEKAMADAKRRAGELARELKSAAEPTRAQQRAFEAARKAAKDAETAFSGNRVALHQLRVQMQQFGIAASNLSEHQVRLRKAETALAERGQALTRSLKSTAGGMADAGRASSGMARDIAGAESAWSRFGAAARSAAAALGLYVGARAALDGLKRGILSVAEAGGKFEDLRVQLQTLYGTAEAAEGAFAWVKGFTTQTPFQLEQVTQSLIKLKAMGLDPMDGSFQAIADQASALGASGETLNGIVLALGQAWSKQRLQGEEALQLIERGVPVWELLSRATGKSARELQELSAAGKLGRDAIRALIDEMGRMNAGAAERAMQTLNGQISNLQDNWANFLNLIAESGALDYFKSELEAINDAVREMSETGELQQYAKEAADAIRAIGEGIKTGIVFVRDYGDALVALGKVAIGLKAIGLGAALLGWARDALASAGAIAMLTASTTANTAAQAAHAAAVTKTATSVRALSLAMRAMPAVLALTVAVHGAEKAAEWLASYSQAAEDLAGAEKRVADEARAARSAAVERANQLMQYRDTVILTAEQVAALGEAEREQYRESLEGKRELQQMLLRIALQEELLGQNTKATQAELAAGFAEIREGFAALEDGATTATAAIRSGISPAAQALVADFQALTAEGKGSGEALRALFEGLAAGDFAGVTGRVQALNQMVADGSIKAVEMREAWAQWIAGLRPEEIDVALTTMRAGFEDVEGGAEALADVIRGPLSAALERLGLDAGTAFDGISTANRQALADIDLLTTHLDAAGLQGQQAGQIIAEALGKAVPKTESLAALREFEQRIEALAGAGKITTDQFAALRAAVDAQRAALDGSRTALDGSRTAAEGAAKAFDNLEQSIAGATDVTQLQRFEAAARAAFAAGEISAEQLAAALAQIQQQMEQLGDANTHLADSQDNAAEKMSDAGGVAAALAARFNTARAAAEDLSAATGVLFERLLSAPSGGDTAVVRATSSIEKFSAALATAQRELGLILEDYVFMSEFGKAFANIDIAFSRAEIAFYKQAIAAEELKEKLASGTLAADEFARETKNLASRFNLLNESDLSALEQQVAQVRAEMERLNEDAQDTLTSLQDELLGVQGREDELARRRQERRRAEIAARLAEAKAAGDREAVADLEEALRVLEKIGHEEAKQRRAREEERASRERSTRESADGPRRSTRESADGPRRSTSGDMAPERRVRIDLAWGRRQATVWADDESDLIGLLQHAKLAAN